MPSRSLRSLLWAGLLAVAPAGHGLDVRLQELPPAPGLRPSAALDPLEGVREALNCGLDFLGTAQNCGLSAPSEAASPFLVNFDPLFCRLTMRFSVGALIDGLLGGWLAGAFARLGSPAVGAPCGLGIGPQYCGSSNDAALLMSPAVPPGVVLQKAPAARPRAPEAAPEAAPETAPPPPPETTRRDATGLDHLTR